MKSAANAARCLMGIAPSKTKPRIEAEPVPEWEDKEHQSNETENKMLQQRAGGLFVGLRDGFKIAGACRRVGNDLLHWNRWLFRRCRQALHQGDKAGQLFRCQAAALQKAWPLQQCVAEQQSTSFQMSLIGLL
eukprot:s374_g6.t1